MFEAILWQLWEQSQTVAPPVYGADTPLRAQLLVFLQGKMRLLGDAGFIELSRVAMAELVHAPDRAHGLLDRLSEKEEGLVHWVRDAQGDGRIRSDVESGHAVHQLQAMVKAFAFWPQLALGQPPLGTTEQQQVMRDCVDMFLGFYATQRGDAG
ncbi:MAG: TetR/AcrR family transcriptional regulator C-terminal domain-containing protein [Gammaproteobacteria bacterium]|nr:TetR/AcrR family transcriptional regulator C-terminal domain-containing protein [Gammaproteobacteria bacterium]